MRHGIPPHVDVTSSRSASDVRSHFRCHRVADQGDGGIIPLVSYIFHLFPVFRFYLIENQVFFFLQSFKILSTREKSQAPLTRYLY